MSYRTKGRGKNRTVYPLTKPKKQKGSSTAVSPLLTWSSKVLSEKKASDAPKGYVKVYVYDWENPDTINERRVLKDVIIVRKKRGRPKTYNGIKISPDESSGHGTAYIRQSYAYSQGISEYGEGNFRVAYDGKRGGYVVIHLKDAEWIYRSPVHHCDKHGIYRGSIARCSKCAFEAWEKLLRSNPPR